MTNLQSRKDDSLRFFSQSSIVRQTNGTKSVQDPTPFGLTMQEELPHELTKNSAITMSQCPTNTPTGSDCSLDVDYKGV